MGRRRRRTLTAAQRAAAIRNLVKARQHRKTKSASRDPGYYDRKVGAAGRWGKRS